MVGKIKLVDELCYGRNGQQQREEVYQMYLYEDLEGEVFAHVVSDGSNVRQKGNEAVPVVTKSVSVYPTVHRYLVRFSLVSFVGLLPESIELVVDSEDFKTNFFEVFNFEILRKGEVGQFGLLHAVEEFQISEGRDDTMFVDEELSQFIEEGFLFGWQFKGEEGIYIFVAFVSVFFVAFFYLLIEQLVSFQAEVVIDASVIHSFPVVAEDVELFGEVYLAGAATENCQHLLLELLAVLQKFIDLDLFYIVRIDYFSQQVDVFQLEAAVNFILPVQKWFIQGFILQVRSHGLLHCQIIFEGSSLTIDRIIDTEIYLRHIHFFFNPISISQFQQILIILRDQKPSSSSSSNRQVLTENPHKLCKIIMIMLYLRVKVSISGICYMAQSIIKDCCCSSRTRGKCLDWTPFRSCREMLQRVITLLDSATSLSPSVRQCTYSYTIWQHSSKQGGILWKSSLKAMSSSLYMWRCLGTQSLRTRSTERSCSVYSRFWKWRLVVRVSNSSCCCSLSRTTEGSAGYSIIYQYINGKRFELLLENQPLNPHPLSKTHSPCASSTNLATPIAIRMKLLLLVEIGSDL